MPQSRKLLLLITTRTKFNLKVRLDFEGNMPSKEIKILLQFLIWWEKRTRILALKKWTRDNGRPIKNLKKTRKIDLEKWPDIISDDF